MICLLRIFFVAVLLSMVALTTWAGSQVPLWSIPRSVGGHPWFIATLGDTYWAFFTFYLWLAYKEPAWIARVLWLVAIVMLGNMAMASYALAVLLRVPAKSSAAGVLLRGNPVSLWLPAGLLAAFGAVSVGAALL